MEDDDAWLYGDPNSEDKKAEGKKSDKQEDVPSAADDLQGLSFANTDDDDTNVGSPSEDTGLEKEAGELSPSEAIDQSDPALNETEEYGDQSNIAETTVDDENEDKEAEDGDGDAGSEEEDSDDDVQVTIGDIKALPTFGYGSTPVSVNMKRVQTFGGPTAVTSASKSKGIDLDTVGNINGLNIYEFNLDSMEDKPWRKPGADITDYFNYGFNEDTWKIYCERQRKLRIDNNGTNKAPHGAVVGPLKEGQIPTTAVNENSKYSVPGVGVKKAGPPPGRKMSGSIDVIGGGALSLPSRRPLANTKENVIQVIGHMPPGVPPPHLAPTHLPPPNFMGPPPDPTAMSIPTTGSLPPTNIPPPMPGTTFPDYTSGRFGSVPPYDDQFYNGQGSSHGNSQFDQESTQNSWSSSSPRNRERDRERGRDSERYWEHGPREYERGDRRERDDDRRRHHRDYHMDRSRERERYEKGYEKGYEKDYDRDYEREKRHKEHRREREDEKHRSSRRRHHHESDEEPRSSRHKHKRSKREKGEEEPSSSATEMGAPDAPSVSGTPPSMARDERSNSTPARPDKPE